MDKTKYDDSAKGGYSYLEKLALVAQNAMDPKEIGMASANDAKLEICGEKPSLPFLGDWITLEASVVPVSVRAKWAREDLKVIPTDPKTWEADWCEQHKNEWQLQSILRSGNCQAQADRSYADPILGFADMLRNAANLLEIRYAQVKEENPDHPIKTRDDIAAEAQAKNATPENPLA